MLLGACFLIAASLRAQPYRDPDIAKFRIWNMDSVNTSADEYSPYITPNGKWLYLSSSRAGSADLYRSSFDGKSWRRPQLVAESGVNSDNDDGSLCLPVNAMAQLFPLDSAEQDALGVPRFGILASTDRPGAVRDADLFVVGITRDGTALYGMSPIAALNTKNWDSQPAIAPDGTFVIFSSSRAGGFGGIDLFISYRDSLGRYGTPINMGPSINSEGNDFSPYIYPDGRTLFFASDGHGGFGGSDIFVSHRDDSGEWSAPANLGERINTQANESFFHGADRRHFYFSSDRQGGHGGLDLYEGEPNIFAPGYSLLRVSILDTTSGRRVNGNFSVNEQRFGRTVALQSIASDSDGVAPLPSGFGYRIHVSPFSYRDSTFEIASMAADTTVVMELRVGDPPVAAIKPPPPPPAAPEPPTLDFSFDGTNVPFFVSGYYRLNTRSSLADLRKRQLGGDLKTQTYITDVARDATAFNQNERYARQVEGLIDQFVKLCTESYFPQYVRFLNAKHPDEYLEITVRGFADPRPIIGTYHEKAVAFLDSNALPASVSSGEVLDNFKLAGLRASFAREYIEQALRKSSQRAHKEYLSLLASNRIRWRAISGNVDELTGGPDLGTKRRIRVTLRRVELAGNTQP